MLDRREERNYLGLELAGAPAPRSVVRHDGAASWRVDGAGWTVAWAARAEHPSFGHLGPLLRGMPSPGPVGSVLA